MPVRQDDRRGMLEEEEIKSLLNYCNKLGIVQLLQDILIIMLKRLLRKLEDPERPLLGPNLRVLRFVGLVLGDNIFDRCVRNGVSIGITIILLSECADVWLNRSDLDTLLENLQFSLCSTISGLKIFSIYIWKSDWIKIIDYVNRADIEQRKSTDPYNVRYVNKYTRYCRKITYIYWLVTWCSGLNNVVQPLLKYILKPDYRHNVNNGTVIGIEVIRTWVPWNKQSLKGYIALSIYESFYTLFGACWILAIDSFTIVVMVFFRLELEVLRNDCRNIIGSEDEAVDETESRRRIKECHRRYTDLLKYSRVYNSCLSPGMMLYMFSCTIMLCVTSVRFAVRRASRFRLYTGNEFLLFGVTQLFLYCWHSNEVVFASKDLMQGPYESRWWYARSSFQREVCLMMHQFQTPVVFTAGPFTELTLPTFVNILKGAYSYYTILKQAKN
ncbi:odorant receptor Or2-like [Battus philenor]|uniref:odorant receptor Or2-like n=1 Tax=Battus philenor TaxID=42288 RepID=UPI0035CEC6DA